MLRALLLFLLARHSIHTLAQSSPPLLQPLDTWVKFDQAKAKQANTVAFCAVHASSLPSETTLLIHITEAHLADPDPDTDDDVGHPIPKNGTVDIRPKDCSSRDVFSRCEFERLQVVCDKEGNVGVWANVRYEVSCDEKENAIGQAEAESIELQSNESKLQGFALPHPFQWLRCSKNICGREVFDGYLDDIACAFIPTEVGDLYLKDIYLIYGGNVSSSLPTEIGRLVQLSSLSLGNNAMTGTVPTQIGLLTELQYLRIFRTNITGSIPTELGALTKLRWLHLFENSFSQNIPSQVGRLESLSELRLHQNQLFGTIPTELGRQHLLALTLNENHLFGVIPTEIGTIGAREVDLSKNSLSGTLPVELTKLAGLELLRLDGNSLVGNLPPEFGSFKVLQELRVDDNILDGKIPEDIGNLTRLGVLGLSSNRLRGHIPSQVGRLTLLKSLLIANNALEPQLPSAMSGLRQLREAAFGDVECSCKLLSWYPELLERTAIVNSYEVATCNSENAFEGLYPHLLRIEPRAPCLHAIFVEENHIHNTAYSVSVTWKYPDLQETVDSMVEVALDRALASEASLTFLGHDKALATLQRCDNVYYTDDIPVAKVFGFEVNWAGGNRICDFAINYLGNTNEGDNETFSYLIDGLTPALEYEITIRPFFVHFAPNAMTSFAFGTMSRALRTSTKDGVPKGAPLNLRVESVGSKNIAVSWDEPDELSRHGRIQKYRVTIEDVENGFTNDEETASTTATFNDHVFNKIQVATLYRITVSAKTAASGYGPTAAINVSTCPLNAQYLPSTDNECIALNGYFMQADGQTRSCNDLSQALLPGALSAASCLASGETVPSLTLMPGFWRASEWSVDIRKCPEPPYCTPSYASRENSSSESLSGQCAEHHKGTYCFSCEDDYVLSDSGCVPCSGQGQTEAILTVLLLATIVLVPGAFFIFVVCSARRSHIRTVRSAAEDGMKGDDKKGWLSCMITGDSSEATLQLGSPGTKLRILFGYAQVLLSHQRTFQRHSFDSAAEAFLSLFSQLSFTDFFRFFQIQCLLSYDHYDVLLFETLYPLGLILLLSLLTLLVARIKLSWRMHLLRSFFGVILYILFLVYPSVSTVVFATFWCEDFPDADRNSSLYKSVLRSDYRTSCDPAEDPRREGFLVYAVFMVIVYPVGVLAFYSGILCRYSGIARTKLQCRNEEERSRLAKINFLIGPYREEAFWFEAYELGRKLLQTSLPGFLQGLPTIEAYPQLLPLLAQNMCFLFAIALVAISPYKGKSDFIFAVLSLIVLVPSIQLSVVDPIGKTDAVGVGLEALLLVELALFVGFCAWDIATKRGYHLLPKGKQQKEGNKPTKSSSSPVGSGESIDKVLPPQEQRRTVPDEGEGLCGKEHTTKPIVELSSLQGQEGVGQEEAYKTNDSGVSLS